MNGKNGNGTKVIWLVLAPLAVAFVIGGVAAYAKTTENAAKCVHLKETVQEHYEHLRQDIHELRELVRSQK